MKLPIIGITMGDPGGIGSEIIVKTLSDSSVYKKCKPIVIGSYDVIKKVSNILKCKKNIVKILSVSDFSFDSKHIGIIDLNNVDINSHSFGVIKPEYGNASVEYIKKGFELINDNILDATCSAPVNKEAMHMAGYKYAGQTELFGELAKKKRFGLLIISGPVKILYVTNHVPLKKACEMMKKELVLDKLHLLIEALEELREEKRKIFVAALNPHAGDGGTLGTEEIEEIIPAVNLAKSEGINIEGPIPSDSMWERVKNGECDVVLGMYHDQCNIAQKLLGFGIGITYEVGLPFVRTSVMHGTAFDIAGKGIADESTLRNAISKAAEITINRGFMEG